MAVSNFVHKMSHVYTFIVNETSAKQFNWRCRDTIKDTSTIMHNPLPEFGAGYA